MMSEMMVLLVAFAGDETGAASWADAVALKTGGDLRNVRDRAIRPLPEHEALPPVATGEPTQRQYLSAR